MYILISACISDIRIFLLPNIGICPKNPVSVRPFSVYFQLTEFAIGQQCLYYSLCVHDVLKLEIRKMNNDQLFLCSVLNPNMFLRTCGLIFNPKAWSKGNTCHVGVRSSNLI